MTTLATRRRFLGLSFTGLLVAIVGKPTRASTVEQYCVNANDLRFQALINEYRVQNGRAPLALSQTLGAAAEHKAIDMAATGNTTHYLSDGTTWLQNIINHGYPYDYRTENIAWGFGGDPVTIVNAWKASFSHNRNMLNPGFGAIGIKQAYNANQAYKWFTATTFGSLLDTPAVACSGPAPTATAVPTATGTPTSPTQTPTVGPEPTKRGKGHRK